MRRMEMTQMKKPMMNMQARGQGRTLPGVVAINETWVSINKHDGQCLSNSPTRHRLPSGG